MGQIPVGAVRPPPPSAAFSPGFGLYLKVLSLWKPGTRPGYGSSRLPEASLPPAMRAPSRPRRTHLVRGVRKKGNPHEAGSQGRSDSTRTRRALGAA